VKTITYPLPLPEELYREVERTAKETRLSRADTIRQSLALGLPSLRERLATSGRVTNVDPLPKAVLERLYKRRDEDLESIRQLIVAQPRDAE
jgi:hypothetical protein